MERILGLDIGGAAIKACDHLGEHVVGRKFALWQNPDGLVEELHTLRDRFGPADAVAVTMTGELCDCFATKAEGVRCILQAVTECFEARKVHVWNTKGEFITVDAALADPWSVAASNWQALATYCCRFMPWEAALLLDTGSTTTDIIPLLNGRVVAVGRTDPERLASGELVYTGVERTPICALCHTASIDGVLYRTMAEWFATTLDAYLILGRVDSSSGETSTADGKPATAEAARFRLARMIGSDGDRFTLKHAQQLATQIQDAQIQQIRQAISQVIETSLSNGVNAVITSGQGEFLLQEVLKQHEPLRSARHLSLASALSPATSRAACAWAVATLLHEM